ncbi:MAG: asparagine synthetase B, partial [Ginsengibacter sp.]
MCRIAGIINPSLSVDLLEDMVRNMCAIQKHGGPDDEGIYTCEKQSLVLGNRRLSIIDLTSGGHQPMSYSDGRYHITFNGEIYNYPELKYELKKAGFLFENQSDTEVILAAFATWGPRSFARLNGMFAFALWDNFTANLYLVRDASGIKP